MTPRASFLVIATVAAFVVLVESEDGVTPRQSTHEDSKDDFAVGVPLSFSTVLYKDDADFELWAAAHGKRYASPEQRAGAERTWRANKAWAFANTAGTHTLSADGPFADLTHSEFRTEVLASRQAEYFSSSLSHGEERAEDAAVSSSSSSSALPPTADWVGAGAVGPIFNQGKCGSCWAVAAVEAMEAIFEMQTRVFVQGSVQQVLDCDALASGCDGGAFNTAFAWAVANGGVAAAADYPYESAKGTCASGVEGASGLSPSPSPSRAKAKAINIDGFAGVPAGELNLLRRVSKQPAAAAVEASREVQLYHSGVLRPADAACGLGVNHGVLVVGYDTTGGGGGRGEEGPRIVWFGTPRCFFHCF